MACLNYRTPAFKKNVKYDIFGGFLQALDINLLGTKFLHKFTIRYQNKKPQILHKSSTKCVNCKISFNI